MNVRSMFVAAAWAAASIVAPVEAQNAPPVVFLAPHAANLPTGAMLPKGAWEFEISHRFSPPVSEGVDALWGFDGPVNNRIALRYAASDRVLLGLQRTDVADNLEFNAKVRLGHGGGSTPFIVALQGGLAVNTQLPEVAGIDGVEPQYYAQLLLNAKLGSVLAVGVVPTLLGNPDIDATDKGTALAVGLHGQYWVSRRVSLLAEWVVSESHPGQEFDTGTIGVESRVGGHFFKLVLTNQVFLNPTQLLAGAARQFKPDEWRVGFNITRRF